MDGYNQYPLNHCYDQRGMIYPPQHGDVSYDDWRNFDHHYQMQQVPSYYQDWRNEEALPPPQGYYPPHPHQYPPPQHPYPPYPYPPPPPEEQYHPPPPPPMEEPCFEFHGVSEGNWYNSESSFEYDHQMQQTSSHYQYQEWGSNEGRTTTEELIAHMMERMDAHDKRVEEMDNQLKLLVNGMERMTSTMGALVIVMKEEENASEESEDYKLFDKRDEEGCPLMDTSNKEQEDQEASQDELESEMSISKPLNSSICTLLDIDASIDFILPLDHFDLKKDLEKSLGIFGEEQWKGTMWKEQEEGQLMKV